MVEDDEECNDLVIAVARELEARNELLNAQAVLAEARTVKARAESKVESHESVITARTES